MLEMFVNLHKSGYSDTEFCTCFLFIHVYGKFEARWGQELPLLCLLLYTQFLASI